MIPNYLGAMNKILTFTFLLLAIFSNGQVKLQQKDLDNLIAISEVYSQNPNASGEIFFKSIDSLRTPALDQIADVLIAVGKADKTILDNRFISRPNDDELTLWYVIREIHYNRINKNQAPRQEIEVANEVLSKKIDRYWLLDNYYYRIHSGIAKLFNDADLSTYNFNIDSLGFKNETEKAIFFLNMIDALVGGRFKVLQMMKNNNKILSFCERLPKFNGKEYYYYKSFDYDDFDWIGYDKIESYNDWHIGDLYNTLLAQFNATAELKDKQAAQEIYFNSILHEPKYFKYSQAMNDLQELYEKSK
ncbi:MAG: hypothetical protein ABI405_06005 [Parafilimonas sp.]